MKREAMIDIISTCLNVDTYLEGEGEALVDEFEHAAIEVLNRMEQNGMLPPETLVEVPYAEPYMDNVWDASNN